MTRKMTVCSMCGKNFRDGETRTERLASDFFGESPVVDVLGLYADLFLGAERAGKKPRSAAMRSGSAVYAVPPVQPMVRSLGSAGQAVDGTKMETARKRTGNSLCASIFTCLTPR